MAGVDTAVVSESRADPQVVEPVVDVVLVGMSQVDVDVAHVAVVVGLGVGVGVADARRQSPVGEHPAGEKARREALPLAFNRRIHVQRVADRPSIQPHSASLPPEAFRPVKRRRATLNGYWLHLRLLLLLLLLLIGPRSQRRLAAVENERVAFVNVGGAVYPQMADGVQIPHFRVTQETVVDVPVVVQCGIISQSKFSTIYKILLSFLFKYYYNNYYYNNSENS